MSHCLKTPFSSQPSKLLRNTRIKEKRLLSKATVTDEVRDDALGESKGDVLDKLQLDDVSDKLRPEEEDKELILEDDDNGLESEQRTIVSRPPISQDDGNRDLEIVINSTRDNQQGTSIHVTNHLVSNVGPELVMVALVDDAVFNQFLLLPFKTPSPTAKRPRELLSGNEEEDIINAKYLENEAVVSLLGDNNEVASETAEVRAGKTAQWRLR